MARVRRGRPGLAAQNGDCQASKSYGATDPSPLTTGSGAGFVANDNVTATHSRTSGETAAAVRTASPPR